MDVMKRLLQFWLWLVAAIASQGATLNYNLGDYTLNPTNVLLSNLVSTAQIAWSMGQSGRITGTITFPTTFDENWTNIANVLTPVSVNVRGLSWGTNNNLIAGTVFANTPPSGQNTIYGLESATNITGGSGFNTFFGWHIAAAMTSGEENTAVGAPALESVTTGEQNTAVGSDALISLQTGNDNAALGYGALTQAQNSRNTGVGRGAGDGLTTGGGNTFLGWFADTAVNSVTNSTAIGQNSVLTKSNQIVFGSGVTNYQFNAVDYVFPAANGAGALLNDSAGFLSWGTSVPSWNVGGTLTADAARITNGLTVGGTASVSSLNVTNALNASGTVGASILRVTNETTHLGPVTNHTTMRATNIFDGGWLEVVGPQTNRADIYVAGGVFADSARITNALNVSGTVNASILRVTNETTHLGLMTNHSTSRMTNIFDGGWLEVVGLQTNRTDIYGAGGVFIDNARITNTVNMSGTVGASILRVTNEATFVGLVTNHQTLRATNIFNGGWARNVSPATNEALTVVTNVLNGGWLQSSGAVTNNGNTVATNILNGGWLRNEGAQTNVANTWSSNIFNGGWIHSTGNFTNQGTVRATNGLVVPSAGGLALGTGTTITNILSASAALTFTAVGSQRYVDASITVTGTTTNDAAFLGVPFQVQQGVGGTNLIFSPFTSNDTVWVRCNNYGTATRSTNGVFNVLVFKR